MPAVIIRATDEDSLQHHGILGMHWGVRRYRNKDGSLTAAGKRRYGSESNSASSGTTKKSNNSKLWKRNVKQGKDKPNTSAVEYIARNSANIADEGIKASKSILNEAHNIKKQKAYKNNAEGKSDQELRNRINRIRLEREYNSLTNEDTSRGYETAMTILNVAGSITSIALSTIGIIAMVKNIAPTG